MKQKIVSSLQTINTTKKVRKIRINTITLIAVSDSPNKTFGCEIGHKNHLHVYIYIYFLSLNNYIGIARKKGTTFIKYKYDVFK